VRKISSSVAWANSALTTPGISRTSSSSTGSANSTLTRLRRWALASRSETRSTAISLARTHNADPVADPLDLVELMRGEQHSGATLALLGDQGEELSVEALNQGVGATEAVDPPQPCE
jgi:hypothetical protein